MRVTQFGSRFGGESGILQLMADLGEAASVPGAVMLGGGNPARIPEMSQRWRRRMQTLLDSGDEFDSMVASYSGPAGSQSFLEALAELLNQQCGWPVGPENLLLSNGSQTAFFFLFSLFAGPCADNSFKQILLPLAPEYIGYEGTGLDEGIFRSRRAQIELLPDRQFKYRVDFSGLAVDDSIGAICVSRPTNPTGNVLTGDEMNRLSNIARAAQVPLIVDGAYGDPFPSILYSDDKLGWEPHTILCLSLSKLGLPGVRTGIVVADETTIRLLTGMNAVISLAPGNLGAALTLDMVKSGEILSLSREVIRPHYQQKVERALAYLHDALEGVEYRIHRPEGAFFLWLWFPNLPIGTLELYRRLKERNVLVVPGDYFFPGLTEDWDHRHQCIRMSYAADSEMLMRGVKQIAKEVKRAYDEG